MRFSRDRELWRNLVVILELLWTVADNKRSKSKGVGKARYTGLTGAHFNPALQLFTSQLYHLLIYRPNLLGATCKFSVIIKDNAAINFPHKRVLKNNILTICS